MKTTTASAIFLALCICAFGYVKDEPAVLSEVKIPAHEPAVLSEVKTPANDEPKFDTSQIDSALGRSGVWIQGLYAVFFPRPELKLTLDDVQLASGIHAVSFITFMGSAQNSEVMAEIYALPNEVTPVIAKLSSEGFAVTGVHNHFLGESPHVMFIHFMGHGPASRMASLFITAVSVTTTPLRKMPPAIPSPAPSWASSVEHVLGGKAPTQPGITRSRLT
jgi:uncharacterized protein DUF1259